VQQVMMMMIMMNVVVVVVVMMMRMMMMMMMMTMTLKTLDYWLLRGHIRPEPCGGPVVVDIDDDDDDDNDNDDDDNPDHSRDDVNRMSLATTAARQTRTLRRGFRGTRATRWRGG
jgi:hypothetical protein